jgi:peptide/nickel transport system ATP-binding protein
MNQPFEENSESITQTNDLVLEVKNLKMHFQQRRGLFGRDIRYTKSVDDVSFTIRRGETLGLVGESGCGKTTVGRCIMRAYKPTSGKILYHEGPEFTNQMKRLMVHIRNHKNLEADTGGQVIDLAQLSEQDLQIYRHEIRMIFQDPYSSLNPRMTVYEIVSEVLRVNKLASGKELQDRVEILLKKVGLRPEYMRRYPHAFSGGERQRIVIARALATNPRLIIADEPLSALDVSIRAQILNLLQDLQQELGLTYLFISHDLSVIRQICDRVVVMYVGKLAESADATTFYSFPKHPYTESLLSSVPIHNPRLRGTKQRIRLAGEIADPANPPSGCYFHPRCPYVQDRCRTEAPSLHQVNAKVVDGKQETHLAACHFAEELQLHGAVPQEVIVTKPATQAHQTS